MVYLMVARQIDLSVGSLLALTGMFAAYTQVELFAPGSPWGWVVSIFVAVAMGVLVGIFQGWWVAYQGVPAFVVTLAGYLMYRGAAFMVADGQTIAPLHTIYQMLGGGLNGSIGVVAALASARWPALTYCGIAGRCAGKCIGTPSNCHRCGWRPSKWAFNAPRSWHLWR
jgi:D-xylose transport system permease protein